MLKKVLCKNSIDAAQKGAHAVEELLEKYRAFPILFLVSGGSPLEIIKYLEPVGNHVTVTVSDDRFSDDSKINNFAQIQSIQAEHWIDTRPKPGETVEVCGVRFDFALKTWVKNNPKGKIVMTQGIGLDGHTVGMIGQVFDDPQIWAVGYDAGTKNKYPLRVTTTAPFLRMVDDSVLYVCGADKLPALRATLVRPRLARPRLTKIPARIIHEMKHCLLFTDLTI